MRVAWPIARESGEGEAKFWLDPATKLAMSKGLTELEVRELYLIIEEHEDEIRAHWRRHFGDCGD